MSSSTSSSTRGSGGRLGHLSGPWKAQRRRDELGTPLGRMRSATAAWFAGTDSRTGPRPSKPATSGSRRCREVTVTSRRRYTILGWLVWQIGSRIVRRKMGQKMAENRVKLGLAGAVLLVLGGGLAALAARSGGDDE